jgi:curved DNA-binding protein
MDHYTTLGVSKTASQDEIKRAYRKLAKQYHPDSGGNPEEFKRINHAYSVVGDERKRQEYDYAPADDSSMNYRTNFSEQTMHEFFRDIFGASAGFHHSQYTQPKNKDLRATLNVDLDTIVNPQRRTIHLKTGRSERTVEVDIPAGVNDGATIRYRGYGQDVLTRVPPGDLLVTIRVHNVHGFTRNGNNIYSDITVDAVDAMLGTSVEFVNLDGSKILVRTPPGAQHGQQLRVAGKGLVNNNTKAVGDLMLNIKISVPKNLSEKQIDLLKQFKNH